MYDNVLIPPSVMASVVASYHANINHWRQLADENQDMAAVLPGKPSLNGKPRMFTALQAALFALMADFNVAGIKAPLAAKIARRVMEAHETQPEVGQWVIVVTSNGNVSTLEYDQTDLRAGVVSGARLNFALVVDLRSYADQVAIAIADASRVIGGDNGE